jgi:hypothetical protein
MGLTYDEAIFRVLLQREEAKEGLKFSTLEQALPKSLKKLIEPDWRHFISSENLDFYSAFQKAVRKHLPGIYYVVMAAEFLSKLPFHTVLSYFLLKSEIDWNQHGTTEEDVFTAADWLWEEAQARQRKATGKVGSPKLPVPKRPSPQVDVRPNPTKLFLAGRRCAFCKRFVPLRELADHVDKHLNPIHLGVGRPPVVAQQSPIISQSEPITADSGDPLPSHPARFYQHRCIVCGNVSIPGDFYCYFCAPD